MNIDIFFRKEYGTGVVVSKGQSGTQDRGWILLRQGDQTATLYLTNGDMRVLADAIFDELREIETVCGAPDCDEPPFNKVTMLAPDTETETVYHFCRTHSSPDSLLPYLHNVVTVVKIEAMS